MDYTKENGEFYKVIENGNIISVGRLEGINQLSTIHEVVFITKEEYTEATGIEITEPSELAEIAPKVESDTQDE